MSVDNGSGDSPGLSFDIDIAVQDEAWADVLEDPDSVCRRAITTAFDTLDAPQSGDVSIALTDDAAIAALNRDYRAKYKPTNVLSFPSVGPAPILGDIALARQTIMREASEKQTSVEDHFTHLVVHGFLHLQGYDHETDTDANVMETLEVKILNRMSIDNPYQIKELS